MYLETFRTKTIKNKSNLDLFLKKNCIHCSFKFDKTHLFEK